MGLAVYLSAALLMAALHTHHASARGIAHDEDCGLCLIAHTQTTLTSPSVHVAPPVPIPGPLPILQSDAWTFEPDLTLRSRAPPLA